MGTKFSPPYLNPGVADYLQSTFPKLQRSIPGKIIEESGVDKAVFIG